MEQVKHNNTPIRNEVIKGFEISTFWDIDIAQVDIVAHKRFIVRRVLEYGLWSDFITLKKLYSMEEIKHELQHCRGLSTKAAALAKNICAYG